MDSSGDHFLASTAFTGDEYGGIGRCDPFESVDELLHLRACEDDSFEAKFFIEPPAEIDVGLLKMNGFDGFSGDRPQAVWSDRFFKKIKG